MTHPLRVAENCTTHPSHKAQNLMTQPLSAPAHPPPPILFDQSLTMALMGDIHILFFFFSFLCCVNKRKNKKERKKKNYTIKIKNFWEKNYFTVILQLFPMAHMGHHTRPKK